jgi:AraC family transcriptional regulator, transcriptional activator of pobA
MDKIKTYKFKDGLPQEFEIINLAELFSFGKKFLTKPHRTNFYHIFWFQKGTPIHTVDFVQIEIKANTLLFLSKDVVHYFDAKGEFEGKLILFTDEFLCQSEEDTFFLKSSILFNDLFSVTQIQTEEKDCIFSDLFRLMELEFNLEPHKFQPQILKNYLHNFLLLSERERQKQGIFEVKKSVNLDYVSAFRELLEQNYKEQKQVSYFAKKIYLTEKRLNLATRSILGKTPKELIDERVVLEAKRLLAHTTKTVKEIGYELGFEEPTNFNKYFRKHSLITPSQFRSQFK